MKKYLLIFLVLNVLISSYSFAQEIKIVKLEALKKIYSATNDTTYIVNFFATWCGPCIQEMPVLNEYYEHNKNTKYQLIYVSLDNAKNISKLPKFIKKHKLQAPVFLLNESADFSWLPYVDKRWQGSIPATLVINSTRIVKAFFETPLEKGQLEFYLKKLGL